MGKTNYVGKIHPKKTMFLRMGYGSAEGKHKYDLSTTMAGSPIIQSEKTGKWFTLSWENIIDLAIEAGIDKS